MADAAVPDRSRPPSTSQGVTLDDAFDVTPELKARAPGGDEEVSGSARSTRRRRWKARVVLPGVWGGANWGGGAFDPETGTPLRQDDAAAPASSSMEPFNKSAQPQDRLDEVDAEYVQRSPSSFIDGVPILTKPPYAHLVAIDLNRGEIAWKVPFGDAPEMRERCQMLRACQPPDRLGAVGPPGC